MRRQLTLEQSSAIATTLTRDPAKDLTIAFHEAIVKISEIFTAFTVRDFTSVWVIRQPGFRWDKDKDKIFYSLTKLEGTRKGFWVLKAPVSEAPVSEAPVCELPLVEEQTAPVSELPLVEEKAAPKRAPENLTRPWMQEAVRGGLHLRIARSIKKKFPTEDIDDLTSEVGELMLTWGERGLCDTFLRNNKPPSLSILAVWAEQKIRQRVYHDGTDALHREFRGLRTQTEIRKRKQLCMEDLILEQGLKADPDALKTVWVIQDEKPQVVIVAPEPAEVPQDESCKLSLAREFIQAKRKRSPERFARVFDHIKAGTPKAEVALIEGCSELTVSHLFQKVRGDLKEGSQFLGVALLLLRKISEEPFSTLQEIQEENSNLEPRKIEQALEVLLKGEFISEKQGRSFLATEAGRLLGQEA
jgi:hypothetical protein